MNALLVAVLLSMSPIFELRLGIPYAIAAGINPWVAYTVCVMANLTIVPIFFLFLEIIHYRLLHVGVYHSAFDKYMEGTREKAHKMIEKYGMFGLVLLVAIPLPGTGVYTATLAAWFLGMNKWKAFLAILSGVLIAGGIVLGASVGTVQFFSFV